MPGDDLRAVGTEAAKSKEKKGQKRESIASDASEAFSLRPFGHTASLHSFSEDTKPIIPRGKRKTVLELIVGNGTRMQ